MPGRVMGEHTRADCVPDRVGDGRLLCVDGFTLLALHTPGHTDESFGLGLNPVSPYAVFTGDGLPIRGVWKSEPVCLAHNRMEQRATISGGNAPIANDFQRQIEHARGPVPQDISEIEPVQDHRCAVLEGL
jgi:hypothetical protein